MNHPWGKEIQVCSNEVLGHKGGVILYRFYYVAKTFLMNHWLECLDIWQGTSLKQGD